MNRRILSSSIFIIFFLIAIGNLQADSTTLKNTFYMSIYRHQDSAEGKFLERFFIDAFERLGKKLVIINCPGKRINMMLERGELDGDLARLYDFNKSFSNLVRVDEPIAKINISAFASNPDIHINSWHDFSGTDYQVECMCGAKICENNLPQFIDKNNLSYVTHWSQGLRKLALGRNDIYIEAESTILHALKTDEFKNARIYKAGVLAETTVHTFFKNDHSDFAVEFGKTIREMKQDGSIEKYSRIISSPN